MFFIRFAFALFLFVVFSVIHDVLIKAIYCFWKKKNDNGYRCYFWTCKKWHNCPYNGTNSRFG